MRGVTPVMRALVETVAPAAAGLDEAGWAEVGREVDATLATRRALDRLLLALLLLVLEWAPVARFGRRFSRLDPARRARVLEAFSRCPVRALRAGTWGARTLALLGFYGRPAAWAALGYRPDRRGWEALA